MTFDAGTWWLITIIVTTVVGLVGFLFGRSVFRQLDENRADIKQVRENYTPRDDHQKDLERLRTCLLYTSISMMLGALVIVCLLCGSALAAVRWTFYKWERLIRMHDGIMILFEYRDHRDEFLAWREEQKK